MQEKHVICGKKRIGVCVCVCVCVCVVVWSSGLMPFHYCTASCSFHSSATGKECQATEGSKNMLTQTGQKSGSSTLYSTHKIAKCLQAISIKHTFNSLWKCTCPSQTNTRNSFPSLS